MLGVCEARVCGASLRAGALTRQLREPDLPVDVPGRRTPELRPAARKPGHRIRTWERAIDCETLACGSGTVAMIHDGFLLGGAPRPVAPERYRSPHGRSEP